VCPSTRIVLGRLLSPEVLVVVHREERTASGSRYGSGCVGLPGLFWRVGVEVISDALSLSLRYRASGLVESMPRLEHHMITSQSSDMYS